MRSAIVEAHADREPTGIDVWFRQRRASWTRRHRGLLTAAWVLLNVYLFVSLFPLCVELLFPLGSIFRSMLFLSIQQPASTLMAISLLVIFFQLAGGCISYCLPGSDLAGPLGNREFHMQLRRNSLEISYWFALRFVLPVLIIGSLVEAIILMQVDLLNPLVYFLRACMWLVLSWVHAVLAAQLGLRVPGMAIGMRTGLGIFGVLLATGLSAAPVFIVYLTTEGFSSLSNGQTTLLVTAAPLAVMSLLLIGLLAWTRIEAPNMIEELERHSSARRA